jgi:hypothetical protein
MQSKRLSRRSLTVMLTFMAAVGLLANGGFFMAEEYVAEGMALWTDHQANAPHIRPLIPKITAVYTTLAPYFLLGSMAAFLLLGMLLWLSWRLAALRPLMQKDEPKPEKAGPDPDRSSRLAKKGSARRDRCLLLYLLSVLQREGRLVDFLFEKLDNYEDAQIGAAVRNIHAGCGRVVFRNLAVKPILKEAEGAEIVIGKNVDPALVTLTGNVAGQPPFTGVVRHKGWQAKRIELPALADFRQAGIIAPAEVEIG